MKKLILILFCLPLMAHAAESPTPKMKAELFFKRVEAGEIDKAYNRLFAGSSIPVDKPQAVTLLKQQTRTALPIYGKIINHEFLFKEKVGNAIMRLVYILKSEKHPTVWEFYFYKPKSTWFLSNVQFNDQFKSLAKLNSEN